MNTQVLIDDSRTSLSTMRQPPVWGQGGGGVAASAPMLLDLNRWGVEQVAWLPGASGNYFSIPDTNLLDANTAHVHQSHGKWQAVLNCSVARSATQAQFGSASLALTATAAGDMYAESGMGSAGVPVTAGATYTARAAFRAGATARSVRVTIRWYNSSGTALSTSDSATVNDATGAWTAVSVTAVAPANAAFASVIPFVNAAAAGEVHYVDAVCFRVGSSTAFVPSHRITGDLDLRARVAMKDWTPGSAKYQALVGNWGTGSYLFDLQPDGKPILYLMDSAGNFLPRVSTAALTASEQDDLWVRATLDVDNGASGHDVKFWTSTDGAAWTQLGTTITTAGVIAVRATGDNLLFGGRDDVTGEEIIGAFLYAEVRDGIDGPVVASFNPSSPSQWTTSATTATSPEGHTITLNRSGDATTEIVDRNTLAFTGVERLQLPDRAELDVDLGSFTVAAAFLTRKSSATDQRIIDKRSTIGYVLYISVTTPAFYVQSAEGGVNLGTVSSTSGAWRTLLGYRDASNNNAIRAELNGTSYGASDRSGSLANSNPMLIGAIDTGNNQGFKGLQRWMVLFQRVLTSSERAELAAWDGSVATEPSWLRSAAAFYWNADDILAAHYYDAENFSVVNLAA